MNNFIHFSHKKHLFQLLLCLGVFMLPNLAKASHIVGGDISYRCLGNDQYEVILSVYRDCFFGLPQAQFDNPAYVGVYVGGGLQPFRNLNLAFVTDDTLSNIVSDPCLFLPPNVCVHTTTYRGTVTLPMNPNGYRFVYQRCCRNQTIANILMPDRTGATYDVFMSAQSMALCNSSPRFGFNAPVAICAGKPINFNHAATDLDGDSLYYRLCKPVSGGTFNNPQPNPPTAPPYDSIVWAPGFGINNMVSTQANNPFRINGRTALITGVPNAIGQYVVGVCVEEYRNGVLLSTVRRDFQYNVVNCGAITSTFFNPAAQCDNKTVVFTNQSTLANTFRWYFDYPNNLSATSTARNPTFTYPDTGTYQIMLIAEPGSVCADTLIRTVFLQNNSLNADFSIDVFDCNPDAVLYVTDLSQDLISPPVSWVWTLSYGTTVRTSNLQNPNFVLPVNTSGTLRLRVTSRNGCVQEITKNFQTGNGNSAINAVPGQVRICRGSSATLNPQAANFPNATYTWAPASAFPNPNERNPTVRPNATTTYTVTVSSPGNLCSSTKTITVTVDPLPVLDFDYFVNCDGQTVTFTNTSAQSSTYLWNFGNPAAPTAGSTQTSPSYLYPGMGNYLVTLSTGPTAFCKDTITRSIDVFDTSLEAEFAVSYTNCQENVVNVQLTDASVNAQNNTQTRSWTIGGFGTFTTQNVNIVVTSSGVIPVTLTITTADNCTSTVTRNITVNVINNPLPDSLQVCTGSSAPLNPSFNSNYSYSWSPSAGLSSTTAPNPIVTPTSTTTYTVRIRSFGADTCEIVKSIVVYVPPVIGLTTNTSVTTCDPTTTLTATFLGTNIQWLNTSGTSISQINTVTVPVSGTSTYFVTATNASGCTESRTVTVSGGPVDLQVTDDIAICSNEPLNISAVNLDPNDQLTFQWSPPSNILVGANTSTPTVLATPGIRTIFLTATSQFNCVYQDTVEVVVVDANASLDFVPVVQCDGLTVQFNNTSINAFGYVWNFGDPNNPLAGSSQTSPSYTYSTVGTYNVTLDLIYNVSCIAPVTIPVTLVDPILQADFSYEYVSCSEDAITIAFTDTSTNPFSNTNSWNWVFSNGTTSNLQNPTITINQSQSLTATLTIGTVVGCTSSHSEILDIELTEVDLPAEVRLCYGDSLTLNPNGNPNYQWVWTPTTSISDPTAVSPTVFPLTTTTYTVSITNISADTCTIVRNVNVLVAAPINLVTTPDTTICTPSITLSASGANTYIWLNSSGTQIGTNSTVTVTPQGTQTYTVVATGAFGCTKEETVTVTEGAIQLTSSTGVLVTCPQDSIQLNTVISGALNGISWVWTTVGGTILSGGTTGNPVVTGPIGTSTFTGTATNGFGCQLVATITVTIVPFVPTVVPTVNVCSGVPTPLNPGANTNYQYTWSPSTGLSNPNIANPTVTVNSNTTYTVIVGDMSGAVPCMDTLQVEVIVYPDINLQLPQDTILCENVPLTLNAQTSVATTNINWYQDPNLNTSIGSGSTFVVNTIGQTTYVAIATDVNGCKDTTRVEVTKVPVLVEPGSFDYCAGIPITLDFDDSNPLQTYSYQWAPPQYITSGANTANPTVSITSSVDMFVTITNQFGCQKLDTVPIRFFDLEAGLSVTANPDTIFFGANTEVQLLASGSIGTLYSWSPPNLVNNASIANPTTSPEETTTFTVTVSNNEGCIAERTVTVVVLDPACDEPYIFVPKAFTPNGDGNNDMYFVRGNTITEIYFAIYDRWGQKLFETEDQTVGWDGTFKGKVLSPDTYGYYLRAKCLNGQEYFKKGNITLLR